MKRKRNNITLDYLKSLKWEIHKIDFNTDIADTATSYNTSSPLGTGKFWIDLEYIKENYGDETPLMFERDTCNNEDIFLDESEYNELIQHIRE